MIIRFENIKDKQTNKHTNTYACSIKLTHTDTNKHTITDIIKKQTYYKHIHTHARTWAYRSHKDGERGGEVSLGALNSWIKKRFALNKREP